MTEPLDSPLRIDWIDRRDLADGLAGRLGLTFLPGKHGASTLYPRRVYRRELGADLDALAAAGIRSLLLLVDDDELGRWGDPAIVERGREREVRIERRPLADGTAPRTAAEMDAMLDWLTEARRSGDVAVACMGGVGRTGTVAACALVAAGVNAERAIAMVRAVRHPTAVETAEQVAFVNAYERHVATLADRDTVGA